MRILLLIIYNLFAVPLLYIGFIVSGFFNAKIRQGIVGRKYNFSKIQQDLVSLNANTPRIWFHVSSYGEFLQVKPVLVQLKKLNPGVIIIISFFSPSGYEHVPLAPPLDIKCYLPFDSLGQVKKFISILRPNVAVIVRHDVWPNVVWRLTRENIPLLLIDASLPHASSRFGSLINWMYKNLFGWMSAILTISESEKKKFQLLVPDVKQIIAYGDTKYDQVFDRSRELNKIAALQCDPNLQLKKILVVGSSWQTDEEQMIPAFQRLAQKFPDSIMILAPHEPLPHRIESIEHQLHEAGLLSARLSSLTTAPADFHCLIIDQVGLLATLYSLGHVAFVGGSFHYKVHNVLEPAIYGIPVLFGPKMNNSSEAQTLLQHRAAVLVHSAEEIVAAVTNFWEHPDQAHELGERARKIVLTNVGCSKKIARFLLQYLQ